MVPNLFPFPSPKKGPAQEKQNRGGARRAKLHTVSVIVVAGALLDLAVAVLSGTASPRSKRN